MSLQTPIPAQKHKVGLLSLGCPKTLVDSELVLGKLDLRRFTITENVTDCDIAIINTCAFIRDAQEESIDQILRLIDLKKEGEIKKIVVLGCLTQRFLPDLQKEFKEVDAFVGTGEYSKIPQVLERVALGGDIIERGAPGYLYTSGERRVSLTPSYYRYLKISEGCDHPCSFCVIPQFRGRHRSRQLADIVAEAKGLVAEGARELILTGQDTTYFGYDMGGRFLLPELLRELNSISDLEWIRILYAYPSLVTDELIHALGSLEKVCHYLDMPLQHTSDRMLKSMRRGTTRETTRKLIKKLRDQIPDLAIRTTFIVGYPDETETDFQELLDFMEEAKFERLGIFTYSKEEGSYAAGLTGQVPEKVKEKRLQEGMLLQQKISKENNARLRGTTLQVLLEEKDAAAGKWRGRSYMDAPEVDGSVTVEMKDEFTFHPGEFVLTRVTATQEYDLVATLLPS